MKELWKDIKGWEGIYQISNHGRIKSFKKYLIGNILSNKNKTGWYLSIVLCKRGRPSESHKIHRLVAQYFIPNPYNKPEVNHKDMDKQNNHWSNLEWVTFKENMEHAIEYGVDFQEGLKRYNKIDKTKRVIQMSLCGDVINVFLNCKEASRETGVCARNIHQVASKTEYKQGRTRKQAGGYIWRFENEY